MIFLIKKIVKHFEFTSVYEMCCLNKLPKICNKIVWLIVWKIGWPQLE